MIYIHIFRLCILLTKSSNIGKSTRAIFLINSLDMIIKKLKRNLLCIICVGLAISGAGILLPVIVTVIMHVYRLEIFDINPLNYMVNR